MNISYIRQELAGIASLLERKNEDYDDAYAKSCNLFRDYPQSKIYEKVMRICKLSNDENRVENEGLEDALRDCIGYCCLYLDRIKDNK